MGWNREQRQDGEQTVLIGYARVSTQDQNLDLQTEALTKAGCKRIFNDKISGSRAERPGLTKALEMLREGDTLIVWKLDRLGRSVKNLVDLVGELHKQGIQFKSLTDAIDTGTPSGRFFFHVMASLTERERELTGEYPHRAGSRPPAGPQGRAQAKNDRQQDRPSQDAAGQWCAATRRGQESGRVRANSVPLAPGILAGLTYAVIRFLKWPLEAVQAGRFIPISPTSTRPSAPR